MQLDTKPKGQLLPRSRYLLAITVITFAVGALQASDIIELPFGAWFSVVSGSFFSSAFLNGFMTKWGYLSLFALMALESASLPVPSEVVLPLAGYFVYLGTMNFWFAVGVSTLASIGGALLDYYLAVWLGRPFVVGILGLFKLHRDALDRAEAWFEKSGQWTVFAARFIPGLRTIISLPAGLFRLDVWRFIVMTVAGCFIWSVILVYAGVLAGSSSRALTAFASSGAVIDYMSAVVAAMSAAYIVYYLAGARKAPIPSSGH
ncbi:MAG: DedA family protein [Nitrososphaerota archaeon]|nr:DedA family protein [Nitrososphaerota archaeon]